MQQHSIDFSKMTSRDKQIKLIKSQEQLLDDKLTALNELFQAEEGKTSKAPLKSTKQTWYAPQPQPVKKPRAPEMSPLKKFKTEFIPKYMLN
jgi:hypothetical protein